MEGKSGAPLQLPPGGGRLPRPEGRESPRGGGILSGKRQCLPRGPMEPASKGREPLREEMSFGVLSWTPKDLETFAQTTVNSFWRISVVFPISAALLSTSVHILIPPNPIGKA
jgi:hypothetical protein